MERGHRAQWASGEPPAKPSGLKRARLTTHGEFLNRLLRGMAPARSWGSPTWAPARTEASAADHTRGFPKSSPARTEASAADHTRGFPKSSPARTEASAADHTRKFPKYANDREGGACADEETGARKTTRYSGAG